MSLADRKQRLDDEYAKVFNPKAFKETKKADFKDAYAGKITFDLNAVWKWIEKNRKG